MIFEVWKKSGTYWITACDFRCTCITPWIFFSFNLSVLWLFKYVIYCYTTPCTCPNQRTDSTGPSTWFEERSRTYRTTHATGEVCLVWRALKDLQNYTCYMWSLLDLRSTQGPSEQHMLQGKLAWFEECSRTFRTTHATGEPGLVRGAVIGLHSNTCYRWTWLGLRSGQEPSELHMLQVKFAWFGALKKF